MGNRVLTIQSEKCTGCHMCELACSSVKEGEFIPSHSRIRIATNGLEGWSRPNVCLQCEDAMCLAACSTGAIFKTKTQQGDPLVAIDQEMCTDCGACVEACPFGAIDFINGLETIKCDLCGGSPKCVDFCFYGCLNFIELSDEAYQNRTKNIKTLALKASKEINKLDPYHRRVAFSLEVSKVITISNDTKGNK